jgi:hypothetical protein
MDDPEAHQDRGCGTSYRRLLAPRLRPVSLLAHGDPVVGGGKDALRQLRRRRGVKRAGPAGRFRYRVCSWTTHAQRTAPRQGARKRSSTRCGGFAGGGHSRRRSDRRLLRGRQSRRDETDEALEELLVRRLEAIERAEARLREGTFGRSVQSGEPIPDGRLEIEPWAELTVEEQAGG